MGAAMRGRVLGLVVTGGSGPLHGLGIPNDAALTPFAGKYRFIDFALAAATNSGVGPVYLPNPAGRKAAFSTTSCAITSHMRSCA